MPWCIISILLGLLNLEWNRSGSQIGYLQIGN